MLHRMLVGLKSYILVYVYIYIYTYISITDYTIYIYIYTHMYTHTYIHITYEDIEKDWGGFAEQRRGDIEEIKR